MNRGQLQKDFFPTELMLKLFGSETQLSVKLKLINEYVEEARNSYDDEVLQIIKNNQIAHIYWMSNQYPEAITHFEIVIESMQPEDSPSLYFLALNLLIRGNRLLTNYQEAEKWAALAFGYSDVFSALQNLINLNDYVDLIIDSGQVFEKKYIGLIQPIIDELGFTETLGEPVETIRSMNQKNKHWARKLGEMELSASARSEFAETIKEYEDYVKTCEIGWFRNYASNTLDKMKNN